MRSVVVVLPASMCAMIPIFRQRFSGIVRATVSISHSTGLGPCGFCCGAYISRLHSVAEARGSSPSISFKLFRGRLGYQPAAGRSPLPAIMRERLVGLGHAVHIFLLLHRRAAAVGGVQQFGGQLL